MIPKNQTGIIPPHINDELKKRYPMSTKVPTAEEMQAMMKLQAEFTCKKCGWMFPTHEKKPKFCTECGTKFEE